MKRIAILGSTGSIGTSALSVIRRLPEEFRVVALSARSNIELLIRQVREFRPRYVCVDTAADALVLEKRVPRNVCVRVGATGLGSIAGESGIDQVVLAISGGAALNPFLAAIDSGKQIAMANKEALVMAGTLIMRRAEKAKALIIPVDSEQSAIWQCLIGQDAGRLHRLYLTASGGPFREYSVRQMKGITVRTALKHPRWHMGRKITIDSATLMNKGLEVLEAMYLFGVRVKDISVVIHKESVVHSMVEFVDGVILAQLSTPDMRIPIQYALSYPQRLKTDVARVDFCKLEKLTFERPDYRRFPCLGLAYEAAKSAGTMPAVLNAANEISVNAFLNRQIPFVSIACVTENVMRAHRVVRAPDLEDITEADAWARRRASELVQN